MKKLTQVFLGCWKKYRHFQEIDEFKCPSIVVHCTTAVQRLKNLNEWSQTTCTCCPGAWEHIR